MESRKLRNGIHRCLRADTFEEQENRRKIRLKQEAAYVARERKRHELLKELGGWDATIEAELEALGYPAIAMEQEICTEEEFVMSYMLTQIEMELALKGDYDSITEATKSMAVELHADIQQFDENERQTLDVDGSWFNKHHETIER